MARTVVCISRALGAGGEEIGRIIAAELGFRYADEEIIARAAQEAGVSLETVEKAEQTPRLLQRILESMARTPPATEALSGVVPPEPLATATFEGVIERVIRTLASEGNVIIVAHGASLPLADTSGVLRVLVTASPEIRAERLAQRSDLDGSQAKKAIQESDRQRQQYLRRFYDVGSELPTHYDLVINTDALAAPLAARLVVTAVKE
jgi:cytidylate kinase